MKNFNDVLTDIGRALSLKPLDVPTLIPLANLALYHLLEIKDLKKTDKSVLCELCFSLYDYTANHSSDKSAYAKEFDLNTIDYKIVKELILRFPGHSPYEELRDWANYYYYDGHLWYQIMEQMIPLSPIDAAAYAIGHAQPHYRMSASDVRKKYWAYLKTLDPTWKDMQHLVINTMMPIKMVKEMFSYVWENNLLTGLPEKEYYMYLWQHTIKYAKNVTEHIELAQKEKQELRKLLPARVES